MDSPTEKIVLSDLNEDTAIFGQLVELVTASPQKCRHLKIDGLGAMREPPWNESRNIDRFFRTLVHHPMESIVLENIGLFPRDQRSGAFPVRLLTQLLQAYSASHHLKIIELRDCILDGSEEEWELFLGTMDQLKVLEIFVLETCDCAIDFPLEQFTNFAAMINKLSRHSKKLQTLTVCAAQNYGGDMDHDTARLVCRMPALQELTLSNIGRFQDQPMSIIFQTLSPSLGGCCSSRLEYLNLKDCVMDVAAVKALHGLFQCPNSNLKTLRIGVAAASNNDINAHTMAIHNEGPWIALLKALRGNKTLRHVKFMGISHQTPAALDAYQEMMQLNCSLLDMCITFPTLHFLPNTMDFYAQLNALGRYRFLEEGHEATTEEWINKLAVVGSWDREFIDNRLGFVFYLLRLNPLLCDSHG